MKPGIYPGLSMAEYLSMPAVSAHLLKQLLERCPKAAWFDSWLNPKAQRAATVDAACDAGTIAHSILLEGHSNFVQVIDPRDHPNEKGGGHASGWTNKSIKAARDAALAAGKVPIFPEKMREVEAMVEAARSYINALRETEPAIWAAFQPGGGESEVTMVWEDGSTLCRIRPDRISIDRRIIIDYKTGGTTAEPDTWGRTQMVRMGYHVGAAFYRRGVRALCNVTPDYFFLVQEQEEPFLCSLVGIEPAGHELGAKKIQRALGQWLVCTRSGKWPAYPARAAYPELPAYELAREEEVEMRGYTYDYPAMGWKKPAGEHDPVAL